MNFHSATSGIGAESAGLWKSLSYHAAAVFRSFTTILKRLGKEVDEEILKRLLALNQGRAAEEKSAPKKPRRTSRAKSEEEFV